MNEINKNAKEKKVNREWRIKKWMDVRKKWGRRKMKITSNEREVKSEILNSKYKMTKWLFLQSLHHIIFSNFLWVIWIQN